MKQVLFFLFTLVIMSSCRFTTGSGNLITDTRSVGNFKRISVGGSFDVEVKTGTTTQVTVEADDNIMKYIRISTSGDVLKIKTEGLHNYSNVHMKVYITTPLLNGINASASAEVRVLDPIKNNEKLSFQASSSADIEVEVEAPEVDVRASSSGSVNLSGRTKNYTAQASSSGDIRSEELLTENANVSVSSSGSAYVHASVSLNARASSSGDIVYHGGASVTKSVSSSGSVEKRE
jgi:hypothetical protein